MLDQSYDILSIRNFYAVWVIFLHVFHVKALTGVRVDYGGRELPQILLRDCYSLFAEHVLVEEVAEVTYEGEELRVDVGLRLVVDYLDLNQLVKVFLCRVDVKVQFLASYLY